MLHTNNRLYGDGKVNTDVTTKLSKIKSCNRIVKTYDKNNIYRYSCVVPLTVLLATHFLSLRHLPTIGAGAPVRLARLRSRTDLDFFHFLVPIN